MSTYSIELLDDEGRFVTVRFEQGQSPLVVGLPPGYSGPTGGKAIAYTVHARAMVAARLHQSTWHISAACEELWPGSIAPEDRQERNGWYLRGIVRSYRRRFPEVLREQPLETIVGLDDLALFSELDGDTPLDRIESEIESFMLFELSDRRARAAQLDKDAPVPFAIGTAPYRQQWDTFEPLFRQRRDKGDLRLENLYPLLDDYYRALDPLRAIPIRTDAASAGASLARLVVLANLALQAIAETRQGGELPLVNGVSSQRIKSWPHERPVHLSRLVLKSLRRIEHLDLVLTPPESSEQGQWLVFLGDNGTGKTTILRAFALALLPKETAAAMLRELGNGGPLLRHEADSGSILVTLGNEDEQVVTIDQATDGRMESLYSRPTLPLPPVFGYGCRRGSALGGPSREAKSDPRDGCNTLFDENAYLLHADTWLRDLLLAEGNASGPIMKAVHAVLRQVMDIDIHIEPEATWVEGAGMGRVRVSALSDGYITTLGWLVDFMARWLKYAREAGYEIGEDFAARMPAVVLIDEIDLHLHPRWQRRVIDSLRSTFPRTTFITTTHNALTLSGFKADEIVCLVSDGEGVIRAVQPNVSPMFKTSSELHETFFGIEHYLPDGLDRALFEYATLAGNPGRSDEDERKMHELRAQLESAGIRPMKPIAREVSQ